MSPAPDTKPGQPNIQDVFLNYVRREKLTVTIRMMAKAWGVKRPSTLGIRPPTKK